MNLPPAELLKLQLDLHRQILLQQQELQRQQLEVQRQLQWLQHQQVLQGGANGGHGEANREKKLRNPRNPALRNAKGEVMDARPWEDKPTTVMVRGIPRHYTQRQLLEVVESLGFQGLFDFLYLPWDIKYDKNAGGYGFINFREQEYAVMFREACKQHEVEGKTIQVHPAQLQGFEANYKHFASSKIGQHEAHRPIFIPQACNVLD